MKRHKLMKKKKKKKMGYLWVKSIAAANRGVMNSAFEMPYLIPWLWPHKRDLVIASSNQSPQCIKFTLQLRKKEKETRYDQEMWLKYHEIKQQVGWYSFSVLNCLPPHWSSTLAPVHCLSGQPGPQWGHTQYAVSQIPICSEDESRLMWTTPLRGSIRQVLL